MKTLILSTLLIAAIPAIAGTTVPDVASNQSVSMSGPGWQIRTAL